jgi:hypothetical protein
MLSDNPSYDVPDHKTIKHKPINTSFLFKVGNVYAKDVLKDPSMVESTITRFFGVFFMFFQTSLVWGSLIASFCKRAVCVCVCISLRAFFD